MSAEPSKPPADLDGLAAEINALLAREDEALGPFENEQDKAAEAYEAQRREIQGRAEAAVKDLRIEAGRLLIAAKAKVARGGWKAWVRTNIVAGAATHHSLSDCYACMKMAGAVDPEKERAKEKAGNRERKARQRKREREANTSVTTGDVTDATATAAGLVAHEPATAPTPEPPHSAPALVMALHHPEPEEPAILVCRL